MASPLVLKKMNGEVIVRDTQGDDRYKERHAACLARSGDHDPRGPKQR